MTTVDLYRQRAKEARGKAATASDELSRLVWLEIAKGFEKLAEQPERDPVWRVERVSPKKNPHERTISIGRRKPTARTKLVRASQR
ncbi:MAG TPA: hypothetical protein VGU20_25585 [Stellaceae bacterium]|nr:hypothetical protein [Stellaceae bacterium]